MKKTAGFTLIELLIVIAIIGILAAVLIPNLLNARTVAQKRAEQAYAMNVYKVANAYLAENTTATTVTTSCTGSSGYTMGSYSTGGGAPGTLTACAISADGKTVTYSGLSGSNLTVGQ